MNFSSKKIWKNISDRKKNSGNNKKKKVNIYVIWSVLWPSFFLKRDMRKFFFWTLKGKRVIKWAFFGKNEQQKTLKRW